MPKNRRFWLGKECISLVPPRADTLLYSAQVSAKGSVVTLAWRNRHKEVVSSPPTSKDLSPTQREPRNKNPRAVRGCRGRGQKIRRVAMRLPLRTAYVAWLAIDRTKRLWGGSAGPWSEARVIAARTAGSVTASGGAAYGAARRTGDTIRRSGVKMAFEEMRVDAAQFVQRNWNRRARVARLPGLLHGVDQRGDTSGPGRGANYGAFVPLLILSSNPLSGLMVGYAGLAGVTGLFTADLTMRGLRRLLPTASVQRSLPAAPGNEILEETLELRSRETV